MKVYSFSLGFLACFIMVASLFFAGCESQAPSVEAKTAIAEPGPAIAEKPAEPEPAVAETPAEPKPPVTEKPAEPKPPVTEKPAELKPAVAEKPAEPKPPVTEKPAKPRPPVVEKPVEPVDTGIAVTVNGVDITEKQIDDLIAPRIEQMSKNRNWPPHIIESYKERMRKDALNELIETQLVGAKIKEANIVVTEDEIEAHIREIIVSEGLTLEELKILIESHGSTFEKWKEMMQFPKRLAFTKLVEPKIAGKVNITEEDAREFYNKNVNSYKTPEQVKASHILIKPDKPDPNTDPDEAGAAAKAKAEQLLEKIKAGADFAELARANSACSSAADGGDLGLIAKGRMVPPFEKAAFELEVGQVSNVVKTRFGYHIIKVTDRKEATVTTFEQAKDEIINRLTGEKRDEIAINYVKSLVEGANIVYPPGKEPKPEAAPPGRPPGRRQRP